MKVRNTAKIIAKIAKKMADHASGAASSWGSYQTKQPKRPQ